MMINDFVWQGDKEMRLDDPYVFNLQDVIIGVYGGNTSSGANKNEDGALVWRAPGNKLKECLSSSPSSRMLSI